MIDNKEILRRQKDNISNQLRYYKNKYGYLIDEKEYKKFKSKLPIIKKVYKHHDFICNVPQHKIPYHFVEFYAKNYNILKLGYGIKDYLLKLKKVNSEAKSEIKNNNNSNQKKYILIF